MPVRTPKKSPQKKAPRSRPHAKGRPLNLQLLMLGIFIDGPGGSSSEGPRYIEGVLRTALVDADGLLRHRFQGQSWDANQASGLISLRVRREEDDYNVLHEITTGSPLRAHVEDALDQVAIHAGERGLWLGMALAFRYFGGGVR